jgi:Tol biopolymer transport system component
MRFPSLLLPALLLTGNVWAAEDVARSESDLLANIRQLTFEGRRAGEGYFSRDGRRLVFQSEREPDNPFFQIYLLDLETGDTRRISPGYGKTTCSWIFPDGNHVLFASTHEDPEARAKQKAELELRASGQERRYSWDYDDHFELYRADLASGELRRLTDSPGYDAEGAVSPDGQWIVFSSNREAYSRTLTAEEQAIFENDKSYFLDLYLMRADGSGLRRLTDAPGYDGGPFFSADGSRICWRRFADDGATAEIFVMNADGSHPRQITRMGAMSWAPFFHPSGDYLIFATNRHGFGNFELYLVDSEGRGEPVRVTFTDGFDGLPAFSPDGRTLAWTSNRTPNRTSQLFLADWNDQEARRLLGLDAFRLTSPEITPADLRGHVEALASDEMEGRLTGTEGERKATAYVAEQLRRLGLEPAGDDGNWYQSFEFTSGVSLGPGNSLTLHSAEGSRQYTVDRDWRPLAFSRTGEVPAAPVAFAGYGIVAPAEGSHPEYDSYVHLDVSGKWVLAFRYLPENVTPERRQHLARHSGLRYKAMMARERGAVGLLVVSGPNSQVDNQLTDLSFDASLGTTSIAVVSISDAVGEALLSSAGRTLKEIQDELDAGEPAMGFALADRQVAARIDLVHSKSRGRNVVARLVSGGTDSRPALVIGAHIDHLGRGQGMSTLARDDEKGQIHYGADDNASGVAGLLEIAEYLVHQVRSGGLKPERDILFGFWSGEELGLLGSSHFAGELGRRLGSETDISRAVAAYLNLDMVGRLNDKLILQGIGSSSLWPSEVEKRNAPVGLPLVPQNDSYLPTDSTSFYMKRVPVLSAFTGTHSEYHSPRDRPETLNYEGMSRVVRLMALLARSVAASPTEPDYVEMKRPQGEGRARLRAYLGTIPDYAQGEVVGVKLSGVIGGGPAAQAGLQGGDVIVELAGRKIENIYDYTYAIEALKIGQPVVIVVQRGSEKLTFQVTPGSRE